MRYIFAIFEKCYLVLFYYLEPFCDQRRSLSKHNENAYIVTFLFLRWIKDIRTCLFVLWIAKTQNDGKILVLWIYFVFEELQEWLNLLPY